MSRFNGEDYEPEYNNAWELWNTAVNRHLGGAKGQQALRDLRDALLALPEKRLIENRLADEQGCVCTVGALALHKRTTQGEKPDEVLADLASRITQETLEDGDYWEVEERTIKCGKDIGLKMTMAVTLAQKNDDQAHWKETPEQRYERVLAWANKRIFEEAAA